MSFQCAKCGKELDKVLEHGSDASKTYLRKNKYDGAEWVELYEQIEKFNFPFLPEPFTVEQWGRYETTFVKFCLCLDCTPRDFNFVGEKPMDNVSK